MLTTRRTYKSDARLWTVLSGETPVGSIIQPVGQSFWRWSITVQRPAGVKTGTCRTREAATTAFCEAWARFRQEMGDDGWAQHIEQVNRVSPRRRSFAVRASRQHDMLTLLRQPQSRDGRFWMVRCADVAVGAIIQSPGSVDWRWSIEVQEPSDLDRRGVAATRDHAMLQLAEAWHLFRHSIGQEGWDRHVARMTRLAKKAKL